MRGDEESDELNFIIKDDEAQMSLLPFPSPTLRGLRAWGYGGMGDGVDLLIFPFSIASIELRQPQG